MNKQLKELTYTSLILAITVSLLLLPIPVASGLGLTLDLSYVPLILGLRVIGKTKTYILCFIFPWFSMIAWMNGGLPGAIFLLLQSLVLVTCEILFNKKHTLLGMLITIFLVTIFSMFINVLLIAPMYQGFDTYYSNFQSYSIAWVIISLIFNPFKFLVVYNVIAYIGPKMEKEDK